MNLDDETYLSAYLDDELDPADRLAAEWSVESSPPLAEQLRSLVQARDAVAGLDRPSIPRDLAPALAARIAADRRRARLGAFGRPARVALAFSGLAGMAASLIFAMILLNRALHDSPVVPDVAVQIDDAPAHRTHPIRPSAPVPAPTPKPIEIVSAEPVAPSLPPAPEAHEAATTPPGVAREQEYRRLVSRMLERPRVRRIVIVTDIQDAPDRVQELIRDDARQTPEFGRISICQDIVVDTDRTEPAEVFAVPMDGRVRRSFVDRLRRQFPDLVEEGDSSPDLVTRLGEVGRVAVFRGAEAAPLGDPPLDLQAFMANRSEMKPDHIVDSDRGRPDAMPGEVAAPVVEAASPEAREKAAVVASAAFVGPPDLGRMAPPRPGESVTMLVWVTRPPKR